MPAASATTKVLNANHAIKTAFGTNPSFYALGELGGGHATLGTDTETSSSSVTISINQANIGTPGTLLIGLYNGQAIDPSGITGITLTVTGNGVQLADLVLSAGTAFQDDPISLGVLADSGTLAIDVSLTVTTDQAGAGFYGNFVLGDPPSHIDFVGPQGGLFDMLGHVHGWGIVSK
jgi:hypothetical protein